MSSALSQASDVWTTIKGPTAGQTSNGASGSVMGWEAYRRIMGNTGDISSGPGYSFDYIHGGNPRN